MFSVCYKTIDCEIVDEIPYNVICIAFNLLQNNLNFYYVLFNVKGLMKMNIFQKKKKKGF